MMHNDDDMGKRSDDMSKRNKALLRRYDTIDLTFLIVLIIAIILFGK